MSRSAFRLVLVVLAVGALLPGQDAGVLRASQLLGMEVRNANGDQIAEVRDLVVDRESGGFSFAVIALTRAPAVKLTVSPVRTAR